MLGLRKISCAWQCQQQLFPPPLFRKAAGDRSATDSVLHDSEPQKAILNGAALVKDIKACVKLLNEVCS